MGTAAGAVAEAVAVVASAAIEAEAAAGKAAEVWASAAATYETSTSPLNGGSGLNRSGNGVRWLELEWETGIIGMNTAGGTGARTVSEQRETERAVDRALLTVVMEAAGAATVYAVKAVCRGRPA